MRRTLSYAWLLMSIFYTFVGAYIAFTQFLPSVPPPIFDYEWEYFQNHPTHFNYLMGGLLMAYGIYRIIRAIRTLRGRDEEE
jgi:uncharacterized membrane-anchored protein YitT (DUF2179 family)